MPTLVDTCRIQPYSVSKALSQQCVLQVLSVCQTATSAVLSLDGFMASLSAALALPLRLVPDLCVPSSVQLWLCFRHSFAIHPPCSWLSADSCSLCAVLGSLFGLSHVAVSPPAGSLPTPTAIWTESAGHLPDEQGS